MTDKADAALRKQKQAEQDAAYARSHMKIKEVEVERKVLYEKCKNCKQSLLDKKITNYHKRKEYRRCLNQDVVVQGNPRVYKALKTEFATVLAELKRIEAGKGVDDELLSVIELISIILGGLKGEDANGE